jgi:lysyl-tRNA synthetase class 2
MATLRQHVSRRLPRAAALAAAIVGLVNIGSALTPSIHWRGHLLLDFEPVEAMRLFHALALPAGAALLLVAPYLNRRRRRAWQAAIALMLALGAFDLLKGLDFEETALTWGLAAALWLTRGAFCVRHDPITLRSAIWRVPLLGAAGVAATMATAWATQGRPSVASVLKETGDLLAWRGRGPMHFRHHHVLHAHLAWIPLGVHLIEIGTLLAIAYVVFRPLAAPRSLPDAGARAMAARLVRRHGSDTLSFFKLRSDKLYFFSADRRAFFGYQIEGGTMILSGDPVGPPEAFPKLVDEVRDYAAQRGLRLGVLAASERLLPLYRELGLKALYLGDEAIVETGAFTLEGRPIRKVRQSVTRLTKAGYTAELHPLAELDRETVAQLERVVEAGRMGKPEVGFSMAMDSLACEHAEDVQVVFVRDPERRVRGMLSFVPCYGRPALSLSMMRRDPDTPNGLTEFMVVSAIELLKARGIEEMSLNFATAAKYLHSPEGVLERALGKLASVLNPYFQIESLYRFNAKFFPRWEPRYAVYEGRFGLPRAIVAGMLVEGQLAKPGGRPGRPALNPSSGR